MIGAILRAMFLELIRDRGALVLAFVLPGAFFAIFAEIFTATAGGGLTVTATVVERTGGGDGARLAAALARSERIVVRTADDVETAAARVRDGSADAALVIDPAAAGGLEVRVLSDPARGAASDVLTGQVAALYASALPDAVMEELVEVLEEHFFPLTAGQRQILERRLEGLRNAEAGALELSLGPSIREDSVLPGSASDHEVAYAAGAIGFMFLLFASVNGAMSVLEERDAGIIDRVLAGPGGIDVLIVGKFLYLVLQGIAQVGVIFTLAWLAYGVDLPAKLGPWLLVTGCGALTAAGLAMVLVTASATRRQAQTVSTLAILVLSAVGGSMVPRYVMPPLFQSLGWLTPNTWAVEAYRSIFWYQETLSAVWRPCTVLAAAGLLALALAVALARRSVTR